MLKGLILSFKGLEKRPKLKNTKCHLLKKSVYCLGHIISAEDIAMDPAKIKAIKK